MPTPSRWAGGSCPASTAEPSSWQSPRARDASSSSAPTSAWSLSPAQVLKQLRSKYGELYRQDNVILSGTHTHSGPGGYFQYTLFWITSRGLVQPTLKSIVNGIVKSIDIAHENMKKGRLFINRGTVENSQINRSPFSYLANPQSERNRYSSNTDKEMVLLKMVDVEGHELGLISWFAVHPVSMNNSNHLVNSDNVGYASYLFEQEKNKGMLPGEGPFVAAFASSNLGDVSPNTRGPFCANTGESCDNPQSTCPVGGASMCMAKGPGKDMFESTRIIGQNIYLKAKELYEKASQEVTGPLSSAHQWVNMSNVSVELNATHTVRTCKPALGHSFAAGTIDGVGALNFTQGSVEGDPFWDQIRDQLLGEPSNETKACHQPKPILFNTGEMTWPHPWHPDIVDVQIVAIGSLAILAVPGEFTTMSGRRLREAVQREFDSHGSPGMNVVIAGLCNVYTHYIATYEEYQLQRYEAASTIYGPHTLSAYIQLYRGLAKAIALNGTQELSPGPEPPFFNVTSLTLLPSLSVESAPAGKTFGDVLEEVRPEYREVRGVNLCTSNDNQQHSRGSSDQKNPPRASRNHLELERTHKSPDTKSPVYSFREGGHLWSCDLKYDTKEVDPLLVVPEVAQPVHAGLRASRDVPLNGHVAPATGVFAPVKPAKQAQNCSQQGNAGFIGAHCVPRDEINFPGAS
uniref:Neutral ceramidase n=1 Tax=Junco hyemalis TaxID=40217 RepID=A0A8C5JLP8_JUNHY